MVVSPRQGKSTDMGAWRNGSVRASKTLGQGSIPCAPAGLQGQERPHLRVGVWGRAYTPSLVTR